MKLDPVLREIGEELKALDAHRSPTLTVEHLLRPPSVTVALDDRAPTPPITHIRWMSAAAAVIAALLVWRMTGPGGDPAVLDRPATDRTSTSQISVAPTSVTPLASWSFDTDAVHQASSVGDATLTLTDDVQSVPGRSGSALSLSGVYPSAAEATGPILDTTRSFTVSTVIRAATLRNCLYQSFVSQDGTTVSGFSLGTTPGCSPDPTAFHFAMAAGDADAELTHRVVSATTITAGTWYHVVAVHDADAKEMRLYVDGHLEGTSPAPITPWSASGPFAVGRARFSAQQRDYFAGTIDTTTVYQQALTDAEVAAL